MRSDLSNPFADYGKIVYGENFIGREQDIKVIENRIVRPKRPGNLAIIGMPRLGKSSLVWNCLMTKKDKLAEKKIIPIWINVGTSEDTCSFFIDLISKCGNELYKLIRKEKGLKTIYNEIIKSNNPWNQCYNSILKFFKLLKEQGYNLIFILDEFDTARHVFRDSITGFQKLRELSYNPNYNITFITTSRRSIFDIEMKIKYGSTFYETFMDHYLGLFNSSDKELYYKKYELYDLELSVEDKNQIEDYSNGHPFLLGMLGYKIFENFNNTNKINVSKAIQNVEQSTLNHYEHLIRILDEEEKLDKLLQILFGPVLDVKKMDINNLLKCNIIKELNVKSENNFQNFNKRAIYSGYSEHFNRFLYIIQREVDLWPIFSQTEKELRNLISSLLLEFYSNNWVKNIEKDHNQLVELFNVARANQEKEKKSFGERASTNILDFTYPDDLFAIISTKWKNIFENVFKKDRNYWATRFNYLAMIRSPIVHNRVDSLGYFEKQIAEGYCKEILNIIRDHKLNKVR